MSNNSAMSMPSVASKFSMAPSYRKLFGAAAPKTMPLSRGSMSVRHMNTSPNTGSRAEFAPTPVQRGGAKSRKARRKTKARRASSRKMKKTQKH